MPTTREGSIIARMSIYADLVCTRCNIRLWLGKAIHHSHELAYFHIGSADQPPNWAREELNAVLWKMLANHARHPLKVIIEGDHDDEPFEEVLEIGGGEPNDVSFTEYLRNWPGLRAQDLRDPS